MSPAPDPTPDPATDPATAWTAALDRLELDVLHVERALATGEPVIPDLWTPPQIGAPLPAALRERAEALLARQSAALAELARARTASTRQQRLARHLDSGQRDRPVYLDLLA